MEIHERFGRQKMPKAFVSALRVQREEINDHKRDRTLENLWDERSIQCLPGFWDELRKLPKDKPARILDLGCGEGIVVKELQKEYPKWEIHGIDPLPKKMGDLSDRIIQCEASLLPYKSNQFDLIYSKYAYPYFPRKIEAVVEALRVAKPGGVVLMEVLPGTTYEIVEDPSHIKELEDKGIELYRNLPYMEKGQVFKKN